VWSFPQQSIVADIRTGKFGEDQIGSGKGPWSKALHMRKCDGILFWILVRGMPFQIARGGTMLEL
jgi:hypothetical protein